MSSFEKPMTKGTGRAKLCGDQYVPDQPLPERAEHDRYITPRLECEQAYAMLMKWDRSWLPAQPVVNRIGHSRPPNILDPGAGPGIWGKVAREIWPDALIHGMELEEQPRPPEYDRYDIGRFPGDHLMKGYDLIVGNPPFNQAGVFVEESMRRLRVGGCLLFLLPLRFCTSTGRRDGLFTRHPLTLYAVYSRRISWREDGARKTPPRDHALFMWKKRWTGPAAMDLIGRKDDLTLADWLDQRKKITPKNPFTLPAHPDILQTEAHNAFSPKKTP
jgi:hypothetical protein